MTALDRYVRLEAVGLWREEPGAPPREVVVSFGNATLLLTDLEERPLGHWALAGVSVIGREGTATVYSMTDDGAETLAIRDPEMVEAIAAVARPRSRYAPDARPSSRLPVGPILGLLLLAGLAFAAPRAIRALAAGLVPPEVASEVGDRMLIALIDRHGAPCAGPDGQRALASLAGRLDPARPPRLRVMDLGMATAAPLPGGTLLLDRGALAAAAGPEVVAGWVALGLGRDPVDRLLAAVGPLGDLGYMFHGDFDDATLAVAAEAALAPPDPAESPAALARLRSVRIDPAPFATALAGVPVTEPAMTPPPLPALTAPEWQALRESCS